MNQDPRLSSRRAFLKRTSLAVPFLASESTGSLWAASASEDRVIDIHQHLNYSGRSDEQFLAHQRAMGIAVTVLLPAGFKYGLDAQITGNQNALDLAKARPKEFLCFANEVTDLPEATKVIRSYLKRGARGIGEQKFKVACDSPEFERIARLAEDFRVPVLMHFQHETYNTGIERFHKILEKYPKVNFIGHAQTWWGNIDAKHEQKVLYPTGPVTPGGITDRLLSDYPNMFGDLSAGSGLNALNRDEEHTRGFLKRHQAKLLYGSDCNDVIGRGPGCTGAQILAIVRRLAPDKKAERKMLFSNAARLFKVK